MLNKHHDLKTKSPSSSWTTERCFSKFWPNFFKTPASFFLVEPLKRWSSQNSGGGNEPERRRWRHQAVIGPFGAGWKEQGRPGGWAVAGSPGRFCCFHFILINILRDRVTQANAMHAHMFTHTCVAGSAPPPLNPSLFIVLWRGLALLFIEEEGIKGGVPAPPVSHCTRPCFHKCFYHGNILFT